MIVARATTRATAFPLTKVPDGRPPVSHWLPALLGCRDKHLHFPGAPYPAPQQLIVTRHRTHTSITDAPSKTASGALSHACASELAEIETTSLAWSGRSVHFPARVLVPTISICLALTPPPK